MGLYKKYRTSSLTQNSFEDTHQLQSGEIIKGYVLDRYNNEDWYAEFTCFNASTIIVATQRNVAGECRWLADTIDQPLFYFGIFGDVPAESYQGHGVLTSAAVRSHGVTAVHRRSDV